MLEGYIKKKLIKHLNKTEHGGDIYEEFSAGSIRADVVLLTDEKFTAYEVKGNKDTLKRYIHFQKYGYLYHFDTVWLVVHKDHLEEALLVVEPPWGLMDTSFKVYVEATKNKEKTDFYLMSKLWKRDLIAECKRCKIKKYSRLTAHELRKMLLAEGHIKPEEIRPLVRKYLKQHKEIPYGEEI